MDSESAIFQENLKNFFGIFVKILRLENSHHQKGKFEKSTSLFRNSLK